MRAALFWRRSLQPRHAAPPDAAVIRLSEKLDKRAQAPSWSSALVAFEAILLKKWSLGHEGQSFTTEGACWGDAVGCGGFGIHPGVDGLRTDRLGAGQALPDR